MSKIKHDFGMNIPGAEERAPVQKYISSAVPENDADITLFYLLQHYNKNNAAAYKAKKQAKKQAKAESKQKNNKGKKAPPQNDPIKATEEDFINNNAQQKRTSNERIPKELPFNGNSDGNFGETFYFDNSTMKYVSYNSAQNQTSLAENNTTPRENHIASDNLHQYQQALQDMRSMDYEKTAASSLKTPTEANHSDPGAVLCRIETMEEVPITKVPFKIGRNLGVVDYVINENFNVSGYHAMLGFYEGSYYIVDQESQKGTYINGYKLEPYSEYVLDNGAIVSLADEKYVFRLSSS